MFLEDIFIALENGIDIFDSSNGYNATEKGYVLSYNIGTPILNYKNTQTPTNQCDNIDGDIIDLNDVKYAADFRSPVSGCGCYTCTGYTRAYIHHLLVTKELLAGILLTM